MRSIETTGKTVEEAVQAGLNQLGLERFEVTVDVVSEGSKGFFGLFGSKPARVRITEREHMPDIDMDQILRPGASTRVSTIADKPQPQRAPRPARSADPRPPRNESKSESRPERSPRNEAKPDSKPERAPRNEAKPESKPERAPRNEAKPDSKPERAPRNEAKPDSKPERAPRSEAKPESKPERTPRSEVKPDSKPERAPRSEARSEREPRPAKARNARASRPEARTVEPERPALPDGPLPDQDPATLSEVGRRAYEYLDKLTRLMGVPIKIYVAEGDGGMSISMMGDTLDALQYLTSLEVNKDRDDYLRVSLDTEHYRAKREESLTRLAERMAARAVKTGRKVVLEPMNPYERRVLHSTLQNHPYVQTHSEGDEPNRRVVITLKADAPQPESGEAARERKPARREGRSGERREKPQREARYAESHADGQETRDAHEAHAPHENRDGRNKPRGPRPPRPPRPAHDHEAAHEPVHETPVVMAQDVPSDPTDDTI